MAGEGGYGKRIGDHFDKRAVVPHGPKWMYLAANSYEAFVAVSAIIAGIVFFGHPDSLVDSSVGRTIHPFDFAWNALYFLGGVLNFSGLIVNRDTFKVLGREISGYAMELAGITFLSVAVLVNAITALSVGGFTSVTATYIALVASGCLRAWAVVSSPKVAVPVEVPGGGVQR